MTGDGMEWINDRLPCDGEDIIFVTGADEAFDGEYVEKEEAYHSSRYGWFDPCVVIGWVHAYDVVQDCRKNIGGRR